MKTTGVRSQESGVRRGLRAASLQLPLEARRRTTLLVFCILTSVFCLLTPVSAATHVTATYDLGPDPRVMATVGGQPQYGLVFVQRNKPVTYNGVEYGIGVLPGYLDVNGQLNDGAGNLYLDLVPNLGATPADSYYVVTVNIQGQVHAEIWVVPDQPTVEAEVCRQAQPPSSTAPALFYQFLQEDGDALPQRQKLNLTGSGVDCADNAGQARTDCTITGGGAGGGATHSIDGVNLAAQDPVNLQDTAEIDFTNPSAGNIQAGLKTSSVVDGKLTASYSGVGSCSANNWVSALSRNASPSCAQPGFSNLSGSATLAQLPVGTANQILGTNAAGTSQEHKTLSTGTSGSDFSIQHSASSIQFDLPTASATTRGALSSADWSTFNSKENALTFNSPLSRSVDTISCPTCEVTGNRNAANGYAGLDASTKLALAQGQEVWGAADLTDFTGKSGSGTTAIGSTITTPSDNQVLAYSGGNWINQVQLVTSVFGRTGAVTAQSGDYSVSQVTNAFDVTVANTLTNVTAPATPAAGKTSVWTDSTDKNFKAKDDAGAVSVAVKPQTCSGTDKVSAIAANGTVTCTTDEGGAGSGDSITVGGTAATDANFSDTNPAAPEGVNVKWQLDQIPSPDDISAYVPAAGASATGVVTTSTQTFGGAKTFNSTVNVNGTGESAKLSVNDSAGPTGHTFYAGPASSSFSTLIDGTYLDASVSSVAALNHGATNIGFIAASQDNTTNSNYALYGVAETDNASAKGTVAAVEGDAYSTGTGNVNYVVGVMSYAEKSTNASTVTNLAGFRALTNVRSLGTVTNNYGMLIDNQAGVGTNNWAIKTGTGLAEFGDVVKGNSTINAVTGFQINGGAASATYLRGNGTNYVASTGAAAGTGSCSNQVVTALNDDAAPTCANVSSAMISDGVVASTDLATANKQLIHSVDIFDPTTTDTNKVQHKFPQNVTLQRISCSTDQGTVDINFDERAEGMPNTAGTDVLSSALQCTTTTGSTATFSNAGIAADAPLNLQISATSGTPGVVRIHIDFQID